MDKHAHWQSVYLRRAADAVSWYRPHLETSLAWIEAAAPDRATRVIDIGGGAATLVDDLLALGYRRLTVLDLADAALDVARARLGAAADGVDWRVGDITAIELPSAGVDLWHDRAVFHFLTRAQDRAVYVDRLRDALRVGGHAIIATFAPDGPERCSGLEVARYSPADLSAAMGPGFRALREERVIHHTPTGQVQPFTYAMFERVAE
jgi:SAM-dependent methyltransferase